MIFRVLGINGMKAGEEPGEVGVMRAKLLAFLSASLHYQPDRLLIHFPLDGEFVSAFTHVLEVS